MDFFKKEYNLIKNFNLICGLWPYQSSSRKILKFVTYIILATSLMIPQCLIFFSTNELQVYQFVACSGTLLFHFVSLAKCVPTFCASTKLKRILDIISEDWQIITDIKERILLRCRYEEAAFWINLYLAIVSIGWVLVNIGQYLPFIWDFCCASKNQSQWIAFQNHGLYHIEILDRRHWACFHLTVVGFITTSPIVSVDLLFLMLIHHAGGLFDIICYKIAVLQKDHSSEHLKISEFDSKLFYTNLKQIVEWHKRVTKILNMLEDCLTFSHLAVQTISVVMLAISFIDVFLYGINYPVLSIQTFLFCFAFCMEMFCLNKVGQFIIDNSANIFTSAYFGNWYELPVKYRKCLSILMAYSSTPYQLTAGKLINLSMENFISIMKTVLSYMTVFLTVLE